MRPSLWVVWLLALLPFGLKVLSLSCLPANYLTQSIYKLAQILVPVLWRRRFDHGRGWRQLWPTDEPWPALSTVAWAIGIALLTALAAAVVIAKLAPYLGVEPQHIRQHLADNFSFTPATAVLGVIFLSTLNAGLEELHFRVWLDRELSRRWGDLAGISSSATLFVAMHLFIFAAAPGVTWNALVLLFGALLIGGCLWSWLARRPGGIHAAWLAHGLTDALLLSWGLWWLGLFGSH